ncbi:hypothetical protein CLV93_11285 [Prolixibacter denitrificans]|uniref:Uncharacterized protein n=1 Tax=Prolixibacter denitrificans TaxID=1541063 RepID=A0A2P8C7J0_9BACT|nr:hypothetical protein CLV93_11285 [Prolixibacter denitrificans]
MKMEVTCSSHKAELKIKDFNIRITHNESNKLISGKVRMKSCASPSSKKNQVRW